MSQVGLFGTGLSLLERLERRCVLGIVDAVSTECGVPRDLILGRGRTKSVMGARRLVCVRLRAEGLSYPEIGYLLARDHTTIMSACRDGAA